jgi:hypothetical protein
LLAAFFAAGREGPDLPGAVPPRAGPRLLGGLLIATMLHGVRARAVRASDPERAGFRRNSGLIRPVSRSGCDARIVDWSCLIVCAKRRLDNQRIDLPNRFKDGNHEQESGAEILEKQMPIHPERFIEHRATDMWR